MITDLIKISSLSELSDTIFNYWVELIENGNPGVPFTNEKGPVADLANMIVFVDRHKEFKIFSKEEDYQLARSKSLKSIERRLLKANLYIGNYSYGGRNCYFEEVFGDRIHDRDFQNGAKWYGEYNMIYFFSRADFQNNSINQERIAPARLKDVLMWHPGGPTLCTRTSGDYWHIIASVI